MSLMGKMFGGKGGDKKRPKKVERRAGAKPKTGMPKPPAEEEGGGGSRIPRQRSSTTMLRKGMVRASGAKSARVVGKGGSSESVRRKRSSMKGKQLGALLIKAEAITEDQLDKALEKQQDEGGLIGQILIKMDICTKSDIGGALRKQRTITTVDPKTIDFDPEALDVVDKDFCTRNRLIPFEKLGNQLCIAMSNVLDAQAKTDIKEKCQMQLKTFDAAWGDISEAIEKNYAEGAQRKGAGKSAAAEVEDVVSLNDDDIVIELPEEDVAEVNNASEDVIELVEEESAAPGAIELVEEDISTLSIEEPVVLEQDNSTAEVIELVEDDGSADEVALVEEVVASVRKVDVCLLPGEAIEAIPMSSEFFGSVIESGNADAERRWLAEHLASKPLPVLPAIDSVGA